MNVADIEIAHSLEGGAGVLVLVVAAADADAFEAGLHELGYRTVANGARRDALPTEVVVRRRAAAARAGSALPGDKSISHRALIFAALADGRSAITHLATGADVHATRARARAPRRRRCSTRGGAVVVRGAGIDAWSEPDDVLDCENSGTDDARARRACSRAGRSCRC